MPYIKTHLRPQYEELVCLLTEKLRTMESGDFNYVIFAAVKRLLDHTGKSYTRIRDVRAELAECRDEIKRRFLDEYEDSKILENGDVE